MGDSMSDDSHLIEHKTGSTELFKGRLLHAFRDTVRLPDGSEATREYIVHPGAVMMIPHARRRAPRAGAAVPLSDGAGR